MLNAIITFAPKKKKEEKITTKIHPNAKSLYNVNNDENYMLLAIAEAQKAAKMGEVPVGALVVCGKQIIAKAHNQTELLRDVTAHAEILAITTATQHLGSKYLPECTLYVTLEPCPMCAGALAWAQIGKLVYGTPDPKRGYSRWGDTLLHPKTKTTKDILGNECAQLISAFFAQKRQ